MKKIVSIILLFAVVLFSSCSKDDPVTTIPQEVITTLNYTLTSSTGETFQFKFIDPDGDGGIAPTVSSEIIPANTVFTGRIQVLNETLDPVEDVTLEVKEEDLKYSL